MNNFKIYVTSSCIPGWFLNPAGLSPPPWRQRIFGRFLAFFLLFLPFHFFWHEPSVAKTKYDEFYKIIIYLSLPFYLLETYQKKPVIASAIFMMQAQISRRADYLYTDTLTFNIWIDAAWNSWLPSKDFVEINLYFQITLCWKLVLKLIRTFHETLIKSYDSLNFQFYTKIYTSLG